ncbi:MAG TPA: exostosin family protein [Candidatus Paceibacterota bacterium]
MEGEPIKLFVAPPFDASPPVLFIRLLASFKEQLPPSLHARKEQLRFNASIVSRAEDADFVVISQAVKHTTPAYASYVAEVAREAKKYNTPVLSFFKGDLSYKEHVEGSWAFKISAFRSADWRTRRNSEVINVPYAEDVSRTIPFTPRHKSARPSVSFCGFAGFDSRTTRLKYVGKNMFLDGVSFVTGKLHLSAYKRGIYFRRAAIRALQGDSRIDSHIILRDSFVAQAAPSKEKRMELWKEYIDNLVSADFALAPRGDANISIRFYEALSAGRIPILIDTDCVLPLESVVEYDTFILRVPHTKMHELGERILAFYETLSDEEFVAMQYRAREAFEKYVRYDSFFNVALPLLKKHGPMALCPVRSHGSLK